MATPPARPLRVGDEARWEWAGGTTSLWMRVRLVEEAPADFPMGWQAEILRMGGRHADGDAAWDPDLTGDLIYLEADGLEVIDTQESDE